MTLPHPIILVAIYLVLLSMALVWIDDTVNGPDYPEQFENSNSSKYISVEAGTAMRSLCSKSNFLMKLYELRQEAIFDSMEPGVDTSSVIKRLDGQIENVKSLLDRDRKILEEEDLIEVAEQNCQYRP